MIPFSILKKLGLIGICTFVLITMNQNCSRVSLTDAHQTAELFLKAKGDLCLENSLAAYSLESFYAVNLNMILKDGKIEVDSDADGLSDKDEEKYGFNKFSRRSNAVMLDKICLDLSGNNQCENLATNCSLSETGFGMSGCDLEALKLAGVPIEYRGLDSDKDGILDLVEVLRGTIVGRDDELEDPDHDLLLNFEEISSGTNPLFYDADASEINKVQSTVSKIESMNESNCGGEIWNVNVERVPLINLQKYESEHVETKKIDFSHDKNENVVVLVLILKPKVGSGNYKIYSKVHKLNYLSTELSFSINDFISIGEVPQ